MNSITNNLKSGAINFIVINKSKLIHIVILLVLFFILQHEYKNFVFHLFSDTGFNLYFDLLRSVFVKALLVFVLVLLLLINHSPFIYVTNIVILILFVYPNLILYEYGNIGIQVPLFMILFFVSVNIKYFSKNTNISHWN